MVHVSMLDNTNGVRNVFHLRYLFSCKYREYVSIPRSRSNQRFYLGHGNIPMQDDPDLGPCKNVVSINLPFPGKGSILPQSSVLVLVTIQLCSRGARGAGHVPTVWAANSEPHSVLSRNLDAVQYLARGLVGVRLVGAAGSLSA